MPARTGTRIRDSRGRAFTLGRLLKSGGAGSVFLLDESPGEVAKLYHPQVDLSLYARKLDAMLAQAPDLPDRVEDGRSYVQIAWPQALVRNGRGRLLGFVMPALDIAATSDLEHVLQERQAREAGLPTALGPKMTLAANLAAVIAELHHQGHYVVDLKPLNLRFYRESLYIAMLDCDGFSVQGRGERFPAGQFTADYLAPEFQGKGVAPEREEAQDRFALAVVVFQLLNSGLHPYSGRPQSPGVPTDLPGRIRGQHYAYGLRPRGTIAPSPVSGHGAMPEDLRRMFDRAFTASGPARPGAAEWSVLLREYATRGSGRLVACARDAGHQHFAGHACAACARAGIVRQATAKAGQRRKNKHKARTQAAHRTARAQPRRQAPGARAPAQNAPPVRATATTLLAMRTFMAVAGPLVLAWMLGGMQGFHESLRGTLEQAQRDVLDVLFGGLGAWLLLALFLLAVGFFVVWVPLFILLRRKP